MTEIGGFFELELNKGSEYHSTARKVNLGRSAFELILIAHKVRKVLIPSFYCDVLLDPVTRNGIDYEFYTIDENLDPVINFEKLREGDYLLYIDYFGLKRKKIEALSCAFESVIIDNSQAFFSRPLNELPTFYSARKFFGVPDGGYFYDNKSIDNLNESDHSSERLIPLLGRIERSASDFYELFRRNEDSFAFSNPKNMSEISKRLLQNIDYQKVAETRKRNFSYLMEQLDKFNDLRVEIDENIVPMVYPLLPGSNNIKVKLAEKRIYIATYWPNVINQSGKDSFEYYLAKNLIPLPIDQRYGYEEMKYLVKEIKKIL